MRHQQFVIIARIYLEVRLEFALAPFSLTVCFGKQDDSIVSLSMEVLPLFLSPSLSWVCIYLITARSLHTAHTHTVFALMFALM